MMKITVRKGTDDENHHTEEYGWLTGVKNTVRNGTDAYGCERHSTEWYGSPPGTPTDSWFGRGSPPQTPGLGVDGPLSLPVWARVAPSDSWFWAQTTPDLALGWARAGNGHPKSLKKTKLKNKRGQVKDRGKSFCEKVA
jgi:hypothetical protein